MLNNFGLFQKITLTICFLMLLVLLITGTMVYRNQEAVMTELLIKNARVITHSIGTSSMSPILVNNPVELPTILNQGVDSIDVDYAYILDKNGVCLAHTDASKQGTRFASMMDKIQDWYKKFVNEGTDLSKLDEILVYDKENVFEVVYPLKINEIRGFYGVVNVGVKKDFILSSLKELREIFILVAVLAVILTLIAAAMVAMQVTRPISEIVKVANNIIHGDYAVSLENPRFREEKYLKESLKNMADTIQAQMVDLSESNQQLDRKVYELEILMSASLKMNSKCYSNEVLEHILDNCVKGLDASWGSLLIADTKNDVLVPRMVRGSYVHPQKTILINITDGIAGKVFLDKETYIANDGHRNERFKAIDSKRESQIENLICVPLVVEDSAVGVINVVNKHDGGFNEDDERLLTSLASLMARSIENAQLYNMAITDGLSGLFIKRYFEDRLVDFVEQAKRYNLTFSLIYTDIDHFKNVNDNFGHVMGDSVIKSVAKRLLKEARDNIDLVARIGGEEFAVILPETDKDGALAFASRLRGAIENHISPDVGLDEPITMSFGVATFHEDGFSQLELVQAADEALYTSKENGRNCVTAAS